MGKYAAVVYFNVLFQHLVRHSDKPRNPPIPAGGVEKGTLCYLETGNGIADKAGNNGVIF